MIQAIFRWSCDVPQCKITHDMDRPVYSPPGWTMELVQDDPQKRDYRPIHKCPAHSDTGEYEGIELDSGPESEGTDRVDSVQPS